MEIDDENQSFEIDMKDEKEDEIEEEKDDKKWKSCGFSLVAGVTLICFTLALKSALYAAIAIFNGNIPIFAVTAACVPLCIFPFIAIARNKSSLINPIYIVIAVLVLINFGGTIYFLMYKSEGFGMLFKVALVVVTVVLAALDVSSYITARNCKKYLDFRKNEAPPE
uniref:Uncharacterized protein n=1 Tax=Panagrolaimus sp. PS1159 TaxID=55785 RepID=A0AC35FK96_9BILA